MVMVMDFAMNMNITMINIIMIEDGGGDGHDDVHWIQYQMKRSLWEKSNDRALWRRQH